MNSVERPTLLYIDRSIAPTQKPGELINPDIAIEERGLTLLRQFARMRVLQNYTPFDYDATFRRHIDWDRGFVEKEDLAMLSKEIINDQSFRYSDYFGSNH